MNIQNNPPGGSNANPTVGESIPSSASGSTVIQPPGVNQPPSGPIGITSGLPPIQDEISPTKEEFQQAFKAVAQFENKDFDSLSPEEKQTVIQNTLIMNKYTALNPDYASVVVDKTLYDTAKEVASAFAGQTVNAQVLATMRTGRPMPPPGTHDISGINAAVPNDIAGNEWFSGNALLTLHLAAIDLAKTNRDAALLLGLMEASLMTVYSETQQEVAHLTNKTYQKQAEQAAWEMAGACVSLGVTAASMGTTIVGAGVGFAKGFTTRTPMQRGAGPEGADIPAVEGGWKGGFAGAAKGGAATGLITQQMSQAGGSAGQIISSLGRMLTAKDLGELERSKVLAQAAADLIKKAMESCGEEARAALEHNEQLRAFLKASDDERVRIFGSITAHG